MTTHPMTTHPMTESLVTERVRAGVVHVAVTTDGRTRRRGRPASHGAGVVWARDDRGTCLIVSNAHVVTGTPVSVRGWDGTDRDAELMARDTARDLALLRVAAAPVSWHPVPPTARPVRAGSVVMAVGHPLGVAHAITSGEVHSVGPLRAAVPLPGPARALPWVQVDLRLAPGNSGGPIVNARGELVGISTMIVGGLGLAIPLADVDRFVLEAQGPNHLAHGWTRAA